jgi:hypothetical protein
VQEKDFIKEGFLGIQSLAGPVYNSAAWSWLQEDGFLSGRDDLAWPTKSIYLILPLLLASKVNFMRVVDTLKTNDEGELKAGFDFSPLKMAALMLFPTGNQLYWLIGSLYSVGFDLFSGSLVPKLLKFNFEEIVKQIKDIKVQMNEDQLSVAFDRYDSDNIG